MAEFAISKANASSACLLCGEEWFVVAEASLQVCPGMDGLCMLLTA